MVEDISWPAGFTFGRKRSSARRHGKATRPSIMPYTLNGHTVLPCCTCGHVKPIEEFYVDHTRPAGYRPACKSCCGEYGDQKKEKPGGTAR